MEETSSPVVVPLVGRRARTILLQLGHALRTHSLFIAIVFVYVIAAWITAHIYHATDRLSVNLYSRMLFILIAVFLAVIFVPYALHVMLRIRPERPLHYAFDDVKARYLGGERLFNGLVPIFCLPPFMSAFSSLKTMIPIINPFSWDPAFARLDLLVHGGNHPWQLLQPVLGYPIVTFLINFFYNLWFFVMFGVLFWQAFSLANPRLRMQYLLTFQISWIVLGGLAAVAFSSGGPCFYGRLVEGPDPYEPLMKYLWSAKQSYPLWALDIQEELWAGYQSTSVAPLCGITAMPSMHVSSALVFALVGLRSSRRIGIPLAIMAGLVMIGCVHLGWHYAVDAYAAIIGTWLIWWTVGRLQAAWSRDSG